VAGGGNNHQRAVAKATVADNKSGGKRPIISASRSKVFTRLAIRFKSWVALRPKKPSHDKRDILGLLFSVVLAIVFGVLPMPVISKWVAWTLCWILVLYIASSLSFPARLPTKTRFILAIILVVAFCAVFKSIAISQWKLEISQRTNGRLRPHGKFPKNKLLMNEPTIPVIVGHSGAKISFGPHSDTRFVDDYLKFAIVNGDIQLTTTVSDRLGHRVVEIIGNVWTVSNERSVSWDKNYTDNTLEVKDGHDRVILQVQLFPDHVELQGEWHDEYDHGVQFREGPEGSAIFGPFAGQPNWQIKPIMKYPSSEHPGQFEDEVTQQQK
jgi:hypothetical protein